MRTAKGVGLALLFLLLPLSAGARGQGAVAFAPVVGLIPDGAILNATPVVSADRRYVRLTLSPTFIGFIDFNVVSVPAAVGGGGNGNIGGGLGGGGLGGGGLGGGGLGGGGGGGGGLRNVFGNAAARRPQPGAAADLLAVARPQVVAEPEPESEPAPVVERRRPRRRPATIVAARPGTPNPEARAATIFRMGQALERAGQIAGAVGYYRDLIRDHPQSPHARTARGRLAALTGGGEVD